ncbi:hypothetical protein DM02DRAFT_623760 [Periconia macrospinosa]|uniref:Uncharacterized protein n=1 Tax=Periconia macrospinosa TaxID=97972 RepID=A0A2V1E537_9PLEO|nr:hypothetical protein DM02DRAFT_623760 [Periconia macrospinosa]
MRGRAGNLCTREVQNRHARYGTDTKHAGHGCQPDKARQDKTDQISDIRFRHEAMQLIEESNEMMKGEMAKSCRESGSLGLWDSGTVGADACGQLASVVRGCPAASPQHDTYDGRDTVSVALSVSRQQPAASQQVAERASRLEMQSDWLATASGTFAVSQEGEQA